MGLRSELLAAVRRLPGSVARKLLSEIDGREVRGAVAPRLIERVPLQETISKMLTTAEAGSVVRPGEFELRVLREYLSRRLVPFPRDWRTYSGETLRLARRNAGLAVETASEADAFSANFLQALSDSSLLVLFPWTQWIAATPALRDRRVADQADFNPFKAALSGCEPWTRGLAGKRVVVVSSFSQTIRQQHRVIGTVSAVRELMPDFELITVDAPVTFAGRMTDSSWHAGFERVKQELDSVDYDVALVSAGSYGPGLAHHAKRAGKIGMHLGAVGQLLFGVGGQRFFRPGSPFLSLLERFGPVKNWVRPLEKETPPDSRQVENGAYW